MADAYRAFRPRAGRFVPLVLAGLLAAMMLGIAAFLPQITGGPASAADRAATALFGLGSAAFLARLGSVRADVGPQGLVVRNLARARTLAWAEVVSVRFGPDRPWVQLDLADGGTLAVMAIQRADGEPARAEARRLATLVAQHTRTLRDD